MSSNALTLQQHAQPSKLLQLPVELVMEILDNLKGDDSPESIVSLSLTCKAVFAIRKAAFTTQGKFNLPPKNYVRLQLLLQKDCGGKMVYCAGCRRLQPHDHPLNCGAMNHRFTPQLMETASQFFPVHACAVMDRHNLGPGHGLPKHVLEQSSWTRWGSTPDFWEQKSRVKIIRDEMYMRVEHTFEGAQGTFDDLLRSQGYWICRHINLRHFEAMMRARARLNGITARQEPYETTSGTCRCCDSNFTMVVRSTHCITTGLGIPVRDYKVTVKAYHNLGYCKRPNDMVFHTLLHDAGQPSVGLGASMPVQKIWDEECQRLHELREKLAKQKKTRRFRKKMTKAATKVTKVAKTGKRQQTEEA